MTKNGTTAIKACVLTWIIASILLTTGSLDAETMTVTEAVKLECYLTIALGIVIILLVIVDIGGEHTGRTKLSNIDKAINCLKMDKLDGHKGIDQLNDAMRYIMRERAERKAQMKEAHRLAERQAR